jgi:RND family efflux transporter MFP subunit
VLRWVKAAGTHPAKMIVYRQERCGVTVRKVLLGLALAALAAAAGGAWRWSRLPQVMAVAAARGTAAEIVYATVGVEPVRWARVASLVRDRIIELCDCEGQTVSQGDVLARLDDREVRAHLAELRAREDFLKREMSRVSELIGRGAATPQAFERTSMELRQIQGQVAVQLERIANYVITAPMAGVVLRRDGEIGEIAEIGQVLFRVGVPKPLQVVAEVNEEDIPRVATEQIVLFRTDAFPDRRLEGRVREITPMGDVTAKTFRIKMALPDDTPLKPGMSVEANIVTREKANALVVPADAMQGAAVLVLEGDRVRRREVVIGIRGTRSVEVLSGLADSEKVASPAAGLRDGDSVRILAVGP